MAQHLSKKPKSVFKRIPDTAENIAKAVMATPPKKDWKYLKREGK